MKPQDFWTLYREAYRRRGLLLAIVGTTLALVAMVSLFLPSYYRASAFVMPSEAALAKPVLTGTGEGAAPAASMRSMDQQFTTLLGLATTGEVRQRAIKALKLHETASDLENFVQAEPGQGSMIRITALASTRAEAIALTNAMAHSFADYYQDLASYQARQNRIFLQSALREAERKRNQAKVELAILKTEKGEAALPVGTASNPFLQQFYSLRAELDNTRSQLGEVEGRLSAIRMELVKQPKLRQTVTKTSDNPAVNALQEQLGSLEHDLLLAQTRYTDKHRKVIELKAQISDLRQRIARESGQLVSQRTVTTNPMYEKLRDQVVDLRTEREALTTKLQALQQSMADSEHRAGQLADSSVLLNAKNTEYETAQTRYQQLKEQLEAARLEERVSATQGEIRVVDEAKSAVGPVTRSGPTRGELLLVGVALSLALGLGTVVSLAFLDTRVRGRVDLLRELELPVPAVIPSLNGGSEGVPIARITDLQPLSPHAEAYRFLRAQLVNRNGQAPVRTLLIATARPGQGGSTTAVNLALSLAEIGERVVLVDADLRRPSLHKFFGQDNEAGLTSLLLHGGEAERALRTTEVENLLLLPAGPAAENPAALLSSARMRHLLAQLRAHSDYVVIDSPSAGAFADAVMLGPVVDGVILVTRANQTVAETERHTKELFTTVGASIIGVVLNGARAEDVDSYGFHKRYYDTPVLAAHEGNGKAALRSGGVQSSPRYPLPDAQGVEDMLRVRSAGGEATEPSEPVQSAARAEGEE